MEILRFKKLLATGFFADDFGFVWDLDDWSIRWAFSKDRLSTLSSQSMMKNGIGISSFASLTSRLAILVAHEPEDEDVAEVSQAEAASFRADMLEFLAFSTIL